MQTVVRPRIEPGIAASQSLNPQIAAFKIDIVDAGNLQFAAVGGLDGSRDIDDFIVIEIQAGDSPARFRFGWLFLDGKRPPVALSNSTTPYRCGSST